MQIDIEAVIPKNLETDPTSPQHVEEVSIDVPESIGDNADQAEKEMEVDLNIRIAQARQKAQEYDRVRREQMKNADLKQS